MSGTKTVSVKLPISLYEKLRQYMKKRGYLTESEAVRDIIREKLEHNGFDKG